jgi:hypothetical protein
MKTLFVLLLVVGLTHAGSTDQPEWRFYVPDQPVTIAGFQADPLRPLIVLNVAGQESLDVFDLPAWLLNPPNPSARITAFAFTHEAFTRVAFSLDQPDQGFAAGSVRWCHRLLACEEVLNPQSDLGLPASALVDALSWHTDLALNNHAFDVSLNTDQSSDMGLLNRQNMYEVSLDQNQQNPMLMGLTFTGLAEGLAASGDLKAYDRYIGADGLIAGYAPDTLLIDGLGGTDRPDLINAVGNAPGLETESDQAIAAAFGQLQAFEVVNSGYAGFAVDQLTVSEADGQLLLSLFRVSGTEQYISYGINLSGTAQPSVDYFDPLVPLTATWFNGTDGLILLNDINLIDDDIHQGNRSLILTLVPDSSAFFSLVDPDFATLTITIEDDEPADLIFKDGF